MRTKLLIVGVMGPGESASSNDVIAAEQVGKIIAKNGWVLLSGGRPSGVMFSVAKSYKENGGNLSIGISPKGKDAMSDFVDLPIATQMSSGRNFINALTSDVIVAIGNLSSAGTLSEVALGLIKNKPFDDKPARKRPVILLGDGGVVKALAKMYEDAYHVTTINEVEGLIKEFENEIMYM